MAWTARIDAIADAGDFEHMVINVSYFDAADTGLLNTLWSHPFTFEFGSPPAEIRAAIKTLGAEARTVQQTIAGLQPQVGTTVNVP